MANTVIKLKKSSTPNEVPSSLEYGEIAINYADGKLYYKNLTDHIVSVSGGGGAGGDSFGVVNVAGSLIIADTSGDYLTINQGDNIELSANILIDAFTITANLKPVYDVANAAFDSANNVAPQVTPAFDRANSKTYTFYQTTAPSTSNAHDLWVNTDSGVVYENFGTTSSPIWAEFGPVGVSSYSTTNRDAQAYDTANAAFGSANTVGGYANTAGSYANQSGVIANAGFGHSNTTYTAVNSAFGVINAAFGVANTALQNTTGTLAGDLTVTGNVISKKQSVVYYTPATTDNAAIHILAANTKGGTGYADIFKLTNLSGGVTNPNKWIRINNTGNLEVVNSAYNMVSATLTDAGNLTTAGTITPGAWTAGQVIKDTILSNSEVTVVSTTIAATGSTVNFVTYNYTPVSASSYLIVHFHLSKYTPQGTTDDSWYSQLLVDNSEIAYGWQMVNDNGTGTSGRSGVLFPLMGRYTNSSTSAKQIQVGARRDAADDSITIDNSPTSMWLRITEVAR